MKRREFMTATVFSAGGVFAGVASAAAAEERPAEKRSQVYKCRVCGSMVEILQPGKPTLVHCDQPMEWLVEKTEDLGREKHVPVIEKQPGGYRVQVGSVPHPMTDSHWILWIELAADGAVHRRFLDPGDKPEATFSIEADQVSARAYCNLHGLWKSV